jgi:hypothetical protein
LRHIDPPAWRATEDRTGLLPWRASRHGRLSPINRKINHSVSLPSRLTSPLAEERKELALAQILVHRITWHLQPAHWLLPNQRNIDQIFLDVLHHHCYDMLHERVPKIA